MGIRTTAPYLVYIYWLLLISIRMGITTPVELNDLSMLLLLISIHIGIKTDYYQLVTHFWLLLI